jgi:hypothetical protein
MRRLILAGVLCVAVGLAGGASAADLVKVIGTGTLSCSTWLKAREANDEVQTSLIVQWIAGFAIAHNYYVGFEQKKQQLDVKLDDIKYFTDKYCRYNPLTKMLMEVAAEYVQTIGGTVAYHNRSQKKK